MGRWRISIEGRLFCYAAIWLMLAGVVHTFEMIARVIP